MTRAQIPLPRARILVVDDVAANRLALGAVLEPLGHELVYADSGEAALRAALKEEDFAVILLDVNMPGLDGFQTAGILKSRPPTADVPIIFVTAVANDAEYCFQGYAQGAVDYIIKPFEPDILRAKVKALVGLWTRQEAIRAQEVELRERERVLSAARYSNLMSLVPQCLWVAQPDGTISVMNRFLRTHLGLEDESPTSAGDVRDAIHVDDVLAFDKAWQQLLEAGDPLELEYRSRACDGGYRWFLGRAVAERSAGEVLGFICSAIDIHEQKQVEEQLRRAHAEKDTFIAAATHELRTPLCAVKLQTEILARRLAKRGDDESAETLALIGRQVARLTRLVEDLLDASRLRGGRLVLEMKSFDVAAQLRDDCDQIQNATIKHSIRCKAASPMQMVGDAHRLSQVFMNLLTNAVRYSPEGGNISVGAAIEDDFVRIVVIDEGLGIPEDKQSLIFEDFGAAHGHGFGGLGLGLSIARGIVRGHGGHISVKSIVGLGTTFGVVLPREPRSLQP